MRVDTERTVTNSHKAIMAQGRTESRAISAYLEALESHRPKRGHKRTPDSIDKRVTNIDASVESASPVKHLSLIRERIDLLKEMEWLQAKVDLTGIEDGCVSTAKSDGQRKGISYARIADPSLLTAGSGASMASGRSSPVRALRRGSGRGHGYG